MEQVKSTVWVSSPCVCVHAKLLQSSPTLRPHGLWPARLPRLPCDSPGKKTRVDCHALLQGIFPTQGCTTIVLPLRFSSVFYLFNCLKLCVCVHARVCWYFLFRTQTLRLLTTFSGAKLSAVNEDAVLCTHRSSNIWHKLLQIIFEKARPRDRQSWSL